MNSLHINIPKSVKEILPDVTHEIYKDAYNFAWEYYSGDDEKSHKYAWKVVRRSITEIIRDIKSH